MFGISLKGWLRIITGKVNPRIDELTEELEKRKIELDKLNEELEILTSKMKAEELRMMQLAENLSELELDKSKCKDSLAEAINNCDKSQTKVQTMIEEIRTKEDVFEMKLAEFNRLGEELESLA